jgi:hypothetical protein
MTVRKFTLGLVGLIALLSIGGYVALTANISRFRDRQVSRPPPWCEGFTVCFVPRSESPAEVEAFLAGCRCPLLPEQGLASRDRVLSAWSSSDRVPVSLSFWFDTDLVLSYEGGGILEQQFLERSEQLIAGTGGGFWVPLRGTQALAAEQDVNGPSVLSWVESGYNVTINGYRGQSVSELMEIAESMPVAGLAGPAS